MSERDDDVLRRYRALDRASPPAHLDQAILAASRVAATPRRTTRWAIPASIAAVMVLALGLVLKVQREAPEQMTAPAARSDEQAMVAPAAKPSQEARPEPVAPPGATANALRDAPVAQSAPPVQAMQAPPPAPARAEFQERRRAQSKLQAPAPAASAPSAPSAADAAGPPAAASSAPAAREAPSTKIAKDAMGETPEHALERIAKLRGEGNDDEADKALETFRREHPDYRIAPAMWERVRRR